MIFKRKVYAKLIEWKTLAAGTSAVLLEGIQKKVSGFFHMSWMGMEFKMSSFVPKEENGQRKIL